MMDHVRDRDELKSLITALKAAPRSDSAWIIAEFAKTGALRAVNNSVVGTSKLLHFAVPRHIPIWDSVVARNFNLVHHHQFATESALVSYVRTLHEIAEVTDLPWDAITTLALTSGEQSATDAPSNVRILDFALYIYSRAHSR